MSRTREVGQTISEATPAAASTVVGSSFKGSAPLRTCDVIVIDALLVGGTGGTLDVYLQRKLGTNKWQDWIHFPQIAAGTTKRYTISINGEGTGTIVDCGGGTDAAPGVALAANTAVNCMPGDEVRAVYVAGASTSVAGSAAITITPYTTRRG